MKEKLIALAALWRKEAQQYGKSAETSGMVDGQHPLEITAYQQTCTTTASVYNACAHTVELMIKILP